MAKAKARKKGQEKGEAGKALEGQKEGESQQDKGTQRSS
jgi:hypothetical protein